MSDISQIALNGVTYNVKDSTARTEAAKKVTASGGDISNTKVAAYTASTASYPVPAAGETPKVFMGKIKKFFEDFISFKDSIVTKTMILNQILNDSTKAASAATVYSVNKRVDDVNSDLAAEYALAGTTFVTDFNNASVPGRYRVYNASGSAAHGPYPGAVGGYVDILTDGDAAVTGTKVYQILHDHNGDAYIRINIAGTSYGTWDGYTKKSDFALLNGIEKMEFGYDGSNSGFEFVFVNFSVLNWAKFQLRIFVQNNPTIKASVYKVEGSTYTKMWDLK